MMKLGSNDLVLFKRNISDVVVSLCAETEVAKG
jgi:hypothetical protein